MTEAYLKELIADKKKFMKYVESTIVKKEDNVKFGLKEKSYKDKLGREVFWEYNESYGTRQYGIYPLKDLDVRVAYFTSDGAIEFVNKKGERMPKFMFWKLVFHREGESE